MKTPKEIKSALRMCESWEKNCEKCPYKPMKRALSCSAEMKRDSLAYIKRLEERIALMIHMHGDCRCCAYVETPYYESPCSECIQSPSRPMWEYEGLPEVENG